MHEKRLLSEYSDKKASSACPRQKSAGIEQLMPWSDFIKEKCSGVTDTSTEKPENRGNL